MRLVAVLLLCSGCASIPGVATADLVLKAGIGCASGGLKAVAGITESAGAELSKGAFGLSGMLGKILSGALVSLALSADAP